MKIFDLHAHPSLKAFGNYNPPEEEYNLWKKRINKYKEREVLEEVDEDGFYRSTSRTIAGKIIGNTIEDMVALYSQSNLDDAVNGEVRCIVHSIYPIEQEFFKRGSKKEKHFFDEILSMISGQSVEKIDEIQSGRKSYFDEYKEDRNLLIAGEKSSGHINKNWQYKIVSNYSELKKTTDTENEIAIILSVEGVQSLANKIGDRNDYKLLKSKADNNSNDFNEWKRGLLDNLRSAKRSKNVNGENIKPVLFITVAHHFFNYVCGHCKSLNFPAYFLDQEDQYHENQDGKHKNTHYFDLGITQAFGYDVFREIIRRDPDNGIRRIIPDIKHMSPQARKDFYQLLDSEEYQNEQIPIICSHTSVNGIKELRRTNSSDEHPLFNASDINTFDEDIRQIFKRDGLIGIMMDDGRSCSKHYKKTVKILDNKIERKIQRSNRIKEKYGNRNGRRAAMRLKKAQLLDSQIEVLKEEIENEYCDIFFRQIFHVVNVLNNSSQPETNAGDKAWDIISLGTDFDGVINPYDYYGSYSRMNEFRDDLVERWYEHLEDAEEDNKENDFTRNLFGRTPEHWIDKVFWHNGEAFLKKYFHDEYLIHGIAGTQES